MIHSLAESLQSAITLRKARPPLTMERPDLTVEEAYQVQAAGMEIALSQKDSVTGYKMGLTSRAKQRDVNVFEPIRGYLLSSMEVTKGENVSVEKWIHPRVEPELAVVLKQPLGEGATLRDVVRALEMVTPALEILDSRYENFTFSLPDVIADNTSAAGFMVGRTNWIDRLDEIGTIGVTLRKNALVERTGAPAAVLGDPLLSVLALAKALGREGKRIEPGMVILTGGITAAVAFAKGDLIEIVWPNETLTFRAV